MRNEIVAAASTKLVQQVSGPIRFVVLEAVAEYGVGRMFAESFHQSISDRMKMSFDCVLIVMVEDEAFRTYRRPLHHHPRSAGDKEDGIVVRVNFCRNLQTAISDRGFRNRLRLIVSETISGTRDPKRCD